MLQAIVTFGFLVFLECVLSLDNALVLAILVRHLPPHQQRRALFWGLGGALLFRLAALGLATQLIQWTWAKYAGGGYLLYISGKYFAFGEAEESPDKAEAGRFSFWKTVLLIELTDIAFAVDSILAAVALSQSFWILFGGGMVGVVMMRFAASGFIGVLRRFPGFQSSAYALVFLVGAKLIAETLRLPEVDFHSVHSPAFWIFWMAMFLSIAAGFFLPRKSDKP